MAAFILDNLSLTFRNPVTEKDYRQVKFPELLVSLKKQIIVAAVFNLLFIFSDYSIAGHEDRFYWLFLLRILLSGMMLFLLYLVFRFKDPFITDYIVLSGTLLYSAGLGMIIFLLKTGSLNLTGSLVVIVAYYIFVPQRFTFTVLAGVVSSTLFLIVYYLFMYQTGTIPILVLSYLLINIFCIVNVREMHVRRRKDYYNQLLEKELRTKLEKGIQVRNRQTTRLRFLSETDFLTGLKNRRYFFKSLKKETEKSRRLGYPLSMVIIDIDFFKRINDTRGHDAGDTVLKSLARILEKSIREIDTVARIGGEEFALLFPGMKIRDAFLKAEAIRKKVEIYSPDMPVTISAGVAEYKIIMSDDDLYVATDHALYDAKNNGRNRVAESSS